jgi:hypothetical protein
LAISNALLLCACDFSVTTVTPTPTATPNELETLRARPLRLPILPKGAPCLPVQLHEVSPDVAPVAGPGPVYAAGFENGVLSLAPAANLGGGDYAGKKVIFFVAPTYHGLILVRGAQIDGLHDMRFGVGVKPRPEDVFTAPERSFNPGGWNPGGSYTRMAVSGCYGYQFDGKDFSEVLVFPAILSS